MSKHGTKPKKTQKLIIPKGFVNPNEVTVIEIPKSYKNEDVVIVKKSNTCRADGYDSTECSTSCSNQQGSSRIYPPLDQSYERQMDSECQTLLDERNIEALIQDLDSYYHAQKNFLIKSYTCLKQMESRNPPYNQSCNQSINQSGYGNQKCSCVETKPCGTTTTGGNPTVIVLKGGCDVTSACSVSENPDQTRNYGGNESSRPNASAPPYDQTRYPEQTRSSSGLETIRLNRSEAPYDSTRNFEQSRFRGDESMALNASVSSVNRSRYNQQNIGMRTRSAQANSSVQGSQISPFENSTNSGYDSFRNDIGKTSSLTKSPNSQNNNLTLPTLYPSKSILRNSSSYNAENQPNDNAFEE